MNRPFPPGDRTYYVSDERLEAFGRLTPEQRLRWAEEIATFLRLARAEREKRAQENEAALRNGNAATGE